MYGLLWLLRAPDEVFWIVRSVIEPCVLVASVVMFVRLLIVLAGRAIRLVRPTINTERPSGPSWGSEPDIR
jgi:hypothetical protein